MAQQQQPTTLSSNPNLPKEEKFDGTNFHVWKFRMVEIFKSRKLWAHVYGVGTPPVPTPKPVATDPDALAKWEEDDQLARTLLHFSMKSTHIDVFQGAEETAADWWKQVLMVYDSRDLMLQTYVLKQFTGLKMADGDPVDKHVLEFRTWRGKMQSAGFLLEEEFMAVFFLTTLPDSWSSVVHALQDVPTLTVNRVIAAMLTEESRRKIANTSISRSSNDKALYMNRPFRGRGRGRPFARGRRGRGGRGGFRPQQPSSSRPTPPCGFCGLQNHTWEVCRKRLSGESGPSAGHLAVTMSKYSRAFLTHVVKPPISSSDAIRLHHSCNVVSCYANQPAHAWYIDSGASQHMTPHLAYFIDLRSSTPAEYVCLGDDTKHHIEGQGTIRLDLMPSQHVEIPDVLYVPGLTKNLVSVRKIDQSGCFICFGGGTCVIELGEGALLATGHLQSDDLYHLDLQSAQAHAVQSSSSFAKPSQTYLWHLRLGHTNYRKLVHMYKHKMVDGLTLDKLDDIGVCKSCVLSKHKRTPFPTDASTRATAVLQLVHSDVCGPLPKSLGGKEYFLTFIDDYTRFCVVYFLRHKSDTYSCFLEYEAWAELQTGSKLKQLRTDNGGEFTSGEFNAYCTQHGIVRQPTNAHTPQQNGVAEHKNADLETSASSMLQHAALPRSYWAEAVAYATYIQNRIAHSRVPEKTPYELWTGRRPNVSHMRVFGSTVFAQVHKDNRKKFEPKSKEWIFVGFTEGIKGYKLLNRQTRKTTHSRDVVFVEGAEPDHTVGEEASSEWDNEEDDSSEDQEEFLVGDLQVPLPAPQQQGQQQQVPTPVPMQAQAIPQQSAAANLRPIPILRTPAKTPGRAVRNRALYESLISHVSFDMDVMHAAEEAESQQQTAQQRRKQKHAHLEPRSSSRVRKPPDYWEPDDFRHPKSHLTYCLAAYLKAFEPQTYEEALACPDAKLWQKAIDSELASLYENKTWSLTSLPAHRKAVGSKWVFKLKLRADGSIDRYKARVVAKGYSQIPGVDYEDTFSPVVKLTTLRLFVALAAVGDYELEQLDVTTAFLYGNLQEEIYMTVPSGVDIPRSLRNPVCKLHKSLYGLKQSPRAWYSRIDSYLKSIAYANINVDSNVYIKRERTEFLALAIYVDDIIIMSNSVRMIEGLRQQLSRAFKITAGGPLAFCLGMQLLRNRKDGTIFLHQTKYAQEILVRYGMSSCKPISTPVEQNTKYYAQVGDIPAEDVEKVQQYPSKNGSIMHLMIGSRQDLAFSSGLTSRFVSNPNLQHNNLMDRLYRYIAATYDWGILYSSKSKDALQLVAYSDADWASDPDSRKSISSYVTLLAGGAVGWSSRRQNTIALSSTEAEYKSLTEACKEVTWTVGALQELGVEQRLPVSLFCDNQSAIALSMNPRYHARTKHIEIQHHYIKEVVAAGIAEIVYCPTEEMTADILTKGLGRIKHYQHAAGLGLHAAGEHIKAGCPIGSSNELGHSQARTEARAYGVQSKNEP